MPAGLCLEIHSSLKKPILIAFVRTGLERPAVVVFAKVKRKGFSFSVRSRPLLKNCKCIERQTEWFVDMTLQIGYLVLIALIEATMAF